MSSSLSPGNGYTPDIPAMRLPNLKHLYRAWVQMDKQTYETKAIQGKALDLDRYLLPIAGGTVQGPRIKGKVVPYSGADWCKKVGSSKVC